MKTIIDIASLGLFVTAFFGYAIMLNCVITLFNTLIGHKHKATHKLPLSSIKIGVGIIVFVLVAFFVLYQQSAFATGEDWSYTLAIVIPNIALCIFWTYALLTVKTVTTDDETKD